MNNKVTLYKKSFVFARHENQVDEWKKSLAENIRCAKEIEKSLSNRFDGFHLDAGCAKDVIKEFGFDRVNYLDICCCLDERKPLTPS